MNFGKIAVGVIGIGLLTAPLAFAEMDMHAKHDGVTGYVNVLTTLSDEANDATSGNTTELKTGVNAEIDFEKAVGNTTVRVDLDFNSTPLPAQGVGTGSIEQAKFVWSAGKGIMGHGISITGGAFNAPIGSEAQDATDRMTTSRGQLAGLVPANIAGVMLSLGEASMGLVPHSLDIYFGNEWVANAAENNSTGLLLSVSPTAKSSVKVGYLKSEGATDTTDIVVSVPHLGFQYLTNDTKTGWGVKGYLHKGPCAVVLKYDSVETDGVTAEPTTLTLSVSHTISESVTTRLEWKQSDSDVAGTDATDKLTLQFVATL